MTLDELRSLDPNQIGAWPWPVRAAVFAVIFVAVLGAGYWFMIKERLTRLDAVAAEEQSLLDQFDSKQKRAAALDQYREQLDEMQRTFGAMLRQLPGQTEVENLLVDIAQAALAAGLEQELFQPRSEVSRDFYAELPISMKLTGGFHQFATFASNVASLPRIVTLHDIKIAPQGSGRGAGGAGTLTMEITARTYRYIDEAQQQERGTPAPRRGRR